MIRNSYSLSRYTKKKVSRSQTIVWFFLFCSAHAPTNSFVWFSSFVADGKSNSWRSKIIIIDKKKKVHFKNSTVKKGELQWCQPNIYCFSVVHWLCCFTLMKVNYIFFFSANLTMITKEYFLLPIKREH